LRQASLDSLEKVFIRQSAVFESIMKAGSERCTSLDGESTTKVKLPFKYEPDSDVKDNRPWDRAQNLDASPLLVG
jgi:hypothetical protein